MSRHKLVKNLDLDDELDDYDGYDSGDQGDELSDEDREQMRLGTIRVRESLPSQSAVITDKQIQEALWHYFYDVEKSVSYLTKTYLDKPAKPSKKKQESSSGVLRRSPASYFKGVSWTCIPQQYISTFELPPSVPGGLLGGSSSTVPKISKLQALAAARKKKASEEKSSSSKDTAASSKVAGSSKISIVPDVPHNRPKQALPNPEQQTKSLPIHAAPIKHPPLVEAREDGLHNDEVTPSLFASTILGDLGAHAITPQARLFSLPYTQIMPPMVTNNFIGPSPDDLVIAAQTKASGKGGKTAKSTGSDNKSEQVANGLGAIKIDDTPRAVSKNLDVLREFEKAKVKNGVNFVVIGHVDAGKSTLMGRLLYDLKVVDQRTIDRYRKEADKMGKSSFALAWVLDQGTEERNRGVTIDIAVNKFETEKTAFTILDAPGHRDFIPNMIAGTSQADLAVLVIDASTGSFESGLRGQTKEHALLARSLGVQRMIICVNKLDTVDWSQDRFDEITQQVSAFLVAAGFQQKNLSFVPCSGLNGDNVTRLSTADTASWYTGSTLVDELESSEPSNRALSKPLRLTIGDIFRGGVQNPLSISGRLDSRSLQVGDALLAQPSGERCYIKGIEVDNEPKDWAVAGQNVTVHLADIEVVHLRVGDVLCSPSSPISNIKSFTAKMLAFEFLTPMQIDVHKGRLHVAGKIREISAVLDKGSGAPVGKKKPRIVKPGQVARVIVELERAVPLESPARVVLRSDGATVAAGLLE